MFAGKDKRGRDDAVFIGINAYWERCPVELPGLSPEYDWNIDFYTNAPHKKSTDYNKLIQRQWNLLTLEPRSVVVASLKKRGS